MTSRITLRLPEWSRIAACAVVLLMVNILIARKLFSQEYSAYLTSIEGTYIAIAREVAAHPHDLLWWPLWDCGIPFQNTYLPLLPVIAGAFSAFSGHSAALAYHQVSAAFFCLGPVSLFLMAYYMTGRSGTAFIAGLAYSIVSPSALLIPTAAGGMGSSVSQLRRLYTLVAWGEGPATTSLAILPLAILFFYLALTRRPLLIKITAGVLMSAVVLANAFGAAVLIMAVLALLATVETARVGRNVAMLIVLCVTAYCWIFPLLPPSVIAAIRMNSPTVEGDYHFTSRSAVGMLILGAGFGLLWLMTQRLRPISRAFLLFAFLTTGVVTLAYFAKVYVLPQPERYQTAMDLAICLSFTFGIKDLMDRYSPRWIVPLAIVFLLVGAALVRHQVRYARGFIRSADITTTVPYRIATWLGEHMQGERVMIGGSYSFAFNDFTNTPQLHGGHEPMMPNFLIRHAIFQIYSHDSAKISELWLKALGAHAISVPGPGSGEYYKPFQYPRKFEGVFPRLWREGDDTIYEVPSRARGLAHVIPAEAVVGRPPVNGLDTQPIQAYVKALEDETRPVAEFRWTNRHSAVIDTTIQPGEAVSIQMTYHPGWHANMKGTTPVIRADGLGFMVVEPACQGACQIELVYDGGPEWRIGLWLSASVTALMALLLVREGLGKLSHG